MTRTERVEEAAKALLDQLVALDAVEPPLEVRVDIAPQVEALRLALASRSERREGEPRCPVCGEGIYDNQSRVTAVLNEMPRTVHRTCAPPAAPKEEE